MNGIRVTRGIQPGREAEVASLYWEAFGQKLGPSLGTRESGVRYLAEQLNVDRVFCASDGERVLGVLGFYAGGSGAVGFSYRALAQSGSALSAPWRAALLLEEASAEALRQGKCAVRLSVVDSNPRARALYERLGFVPEATVSVGPFGRLFGFQASTDMVRRVTQGGTT